MLNKINISIVIIVYFFLILTAKAYENKILFKVDNHIITSIDIFEEIEYLKMINKNFENLEKEKIFEISKNSIIREKIKIIELSKYFEKIEVDDQYLEFLIKNLINQLNLNNEDELKIYIKKNGIKYETIKKKLQIELLWNQLIFNKHSKDVKIDKEKIRNEINLNKFQEEFFISEILFTLEENQKLENKYNKIKKDIELNGFNNSALIHSISSSAKNGGRVGWIKLNSLNKKLKKEVINTKIGSITNAILVPGGFLIIKIEDKRKTEIKINLDEEVETISKEVANKQLNQFSNIYFNRVKKEVEINEF
ncbi:peptidylprolyl isomerase [Candidatus Pelagibacter sp.]|uniref:peptidylprolyl isomerase n=1 Tax=Candidatus Pelagibacter sp. TaxID=2024849 RepID=UPI003F859383